MLQALSKEMHLDQETQEFFENIIDLFSHLQEGHVGRYCFSSPQFPNDDVRGNEHWSAFIASAPDYYMYHEESTLIQARAMDLGSAISDAVEFIDLGTGSISSFEKKVLPIVRWAKPEKFIFVDACRDFAEQGNERLLLEDPNLQTDVFIGNFWEVLPTPARKAVISLQGATLANMIVNLNTETMEDGLVRTLKHFSTPLKNVGGYFMFTYDTNHDPEPIFKGYEHPSYHAMEMTILRRIKRDLETDNFNPDDFEHVVQWHPEWHLSAHAVQAKRDMSFRIGPYPFSVKKGEAFRTGSSFKFTDEIVARSAKAAGYSSLKIFEAPHSTMKVAIASF